MKSASQASIRNKQLGELLRECRIGMGFTQMELARRLNIDRSIISRIENGEISPAYELVKRWAIVTNSRDVIGLEFSGEDWKKVSIMKKAFEQIRSLANSVRFLRRRAT